MARRKQGRRIKRKTQKQTDTRDEAQDEAPKAFVFTRGRVTASLKQLADELKLLLSPNTPARLRARRGNKLRDFVDVAGPLGVSFFLIVSATEKAAYVRLVRSPRGPTLTFRVRSYALTGDLASLSRKPYTAADGVWQANPLLVLSDFDDSEQHQALAATMLRNLFPPIRVESLKIAACRRVVLLHRKEPEPSDEGDDGATDVDAMSNASGSTTGAGPAAGPCIELRQYVIKAAPTNVSRGVKKLLRNNKVPSLGRYASFSDYLAGKGGYSSESAAETDDEEKVSLPQDYIGRGAAASTKVGIKLQELGPRMELELVKVQEGLCDGAVLYHAHYEKTEAEAAEVAARVEAREEGRAKRRAEQERNVAAKRAKADEKRDRRKRRRESGAGLDDGAVADDDEDHVTDAEWYRREVGQEPEEGVFSDSRPARAQVPTAEGSKGHKPDKPAKRASRHKAP